MTRVREISFFNNIREVREFDFGIFYFFDGLVISEIKEGVVFEWEMANKAVRALKEIYGVNFPIAYISNRINNYSIASSDWVKFFNNRHQLSFYSVVGNTQGSLTNIVLERMFFQKTIHQFTDLEKAIEFSLAKIEDNKQNANQ